MSTAIPESDAKPRIPGNEVEKFIGFAGTNDIEGMKRMLAEHGPAILSAPDEDGMLALHSAAMEGHLHALQWLLEQGVPVDLQTPNYRWTALHLAVHHQKIDAFRVLLHYGANADLPLFSGKTARFMLDNDAGSMRVRLPMMEALEARDLRDRLKQTSRSRPGA